ncbi:hypothetical protein HYV82_01120 [Candidatus Woesearchaeota archaeon]|nr:hypothetical protein [Candidatus Woesearchaeota archaeon]
MATANPSATETPAGLMPLVLVVQSPHFQMAESMQSAYSQLRELHDVVYVRNLFLTIASAIYSPVNLYADGWTENDCGLMRGLVGGYLKELKRSSHGSVPPMPPIDIGWRTLSSFTHTREDLEGMVSILGEKKVRRAERKILSQYGVNEPDMLEEQRAEMAIVPEFFVDLGNVDDEMLAAMLAVQAYSHEAAKTRVDVRLCPFEQDIYLKLTGVQTERLAAITGSNGAAGVVQLLNARREENLRERWISDMIKDPRDSIVYCGNAHTMDGFVYSERVHGLLDFAFVAIEKNPDGAVRIRGTFPYHPTVDRDATMAGLANYFASGPIKVLTDLTPRPRVMSMRNFPDA